MADVNWDSLPQWKQKAFFDTMTAHWKSKRYRNKEASALVAAEKTVEGKMKVAWQRYIFATSNSGKGSGKGYNPYFKGVINKILKAKSESEIQKGEQEESDEEEAPKRAKSAEPRKETPAPHSKVPSPFVDNFTSNPSEFGLPEWHELSQKQRNDFLKNIQKYEDAPDIVHTAAATPESVYDDVVSILALTASKDRKSLKKIIKESLEISDTQRTESPPQNIDEPAAAASAGHDSFVSLKDFGNKISAINHHAKTMMTALANAVTTVTTTGADTPMLSADGSIMTSATTSGTATPVPTPTVATVAPLTASADPPTLQQQAITAQLNKCDISMSAPNLKVELPSTAVRSKVHAVVAKNKMLGHSAFLKKLETIDFSTDSHKSKLQHALAKQTKFPKYGTSIF